MLSLKKNKKREEGETDDKVKRKNAATLLLHFEDFIYILLHYEDYI